MSEGVQDDLPKLTSQQIELVDALGADIRVSRGIVHGTELALLGAGHDPELLSRALAYVVEALERASDNLETLSSRDEGAAQVD